MNGLSWNSWGGSDWFFPPPTGQTNHILTAVSKIQESKLLFKAHFKPLFPDSPTVTISHSTMGEKHKVTWQEVWIQRRVKPLGQSLIKEVPLYSSFVKKYFFMSGYWITCICWDSVFLIYSIKQVNLHWVLFLPHPKHQVNLAFLEWTNLVVIFYAFYIWLDLLY